MEFNKLTTPSLLIASPTLQDSNFTHAVLLLVDHNPEGAFALILNRPSQVPVSAVMKQSDLAGSQEISAQIPTWNGGPVGRDMGLILCHRKGARLNDTTTLHSKEIIAHEVALSSSKESLTEMIIHAQNFNSGDIAITNPYPNKRQHLVHPYRFIIGYSGWGAGQLEEEIRQGTWIELPLDYDLLFNTSWQEMWTKSIGGLGIRPEAIAPSVQEYLN